MSEKQYHFFASSCLHWTADDNLEKCLKRQRLVDQCKESSFKATSAVVWKVPVPVKTPYEIDEYTPQIEGVVVIDRVTY